jgi:adenosylcobinamide-phosphate synthase
VENVAVLALALVLDLAFGEPPNVVHPVAWLGRVIGWCFPAGRDSGLRMETKRKVKQFLYGMAVVLAVTGAATAAALFGLAYLQTVSSWAYVMAGAIVLKMTFSIRGLRKAAVEVKSLLLRDKLEQSRDELKALVGRDTAKLSEGQVVSAVVESVAENSCDSVVAPLFFFLIFGVPGAVAYRVINTFDAMVGHHGKWEYLGKFAARLDTAANWAPARISALMIVGAASRGGGKRWDNGLAPLDSAGPACGMTKVAGRGQGGVRSAWRVMRRDWRRTESQNAGWTMGAAAGALGVRLEKAGFYALGDENNALTTGTIDGSLRLLTGQTAIWGAVCLMVVVVRGLAGW